MLCPVGSPAGLWGCDAAAGAESRPEQPHVLGCGPLLHRLSSCGCRLLQGHRQCLSQQVRHLSKLNMNSFLWELISNQILLMFYVFSKGLPIWHCGAAEPDSFQGSWLIQGDLWGGHAAITGPHLFLSFSKSLHISTYAILLLWIKYRDLWSSVCVKLIDPGTKALPLCPQTGDPSNRWYPDASLTAATPLLCVLLPAVWGARKDLPRAHAAHLLRFATLHLVNSCCWGSRMLQSAELFR